MERSLVSTDSLEQRMLARQVEIGRLTAEQLLDLEELDYRQVATADGCRSLSEWTTARLDIHPDTAKSLVRTMRRTVDRPDLRDDLASGDISFDRMEALSRIPDEVGLLEHLDVAGVRREAANRARITAEDEYRTASDQFLVMQPSLDESWWKLWGGLNGATGALIDKTITEAADDLPLSLMDPGETRHGAKRSHWPNSAPPTIRHQPSSPYSSTPPMPPHPTVKPVSCWKPGPGSAERL